MFFYGVFAVCLFLAPRARPAALSFSFLALVIVGLIASPPGAAALTYTNPLILAFIAGVWLAIIVRRVPSPPAPAAAIIAVAGLALLLIVPFWGGIAERLACLIGATICIYGVLSLDLRGATPELPLLRTIGDASYSIYLWHGVAVSIAAVGTDRLGLSPLIIIPASIVGGLVLGGASYFGLEKPIGRLLSRSRRVRVSPARPDAAGAG